MNDEVLVSVLITTYNQEEFICQCLDSVLMQKTNFRFEVFVGNDCSTDNTKELLNKYKNVSKINKNCDMHIFNYSKNKGCIGNEKYLFSLAKRKYIILLEGDDYWTDEYKLQKQVDFLEQHPKYAGVAHEQDIVDLKGNYQKKYSENTKYTSNKYTFKDIKYGKMPFQENSFLFRNYFKDNDYSAIYEMGSIATDKLIFAFVADFGDIYIMPESMSVYRIVVNRYNKTVYESISNGLSYLDKFSSINFKNNGRINFNWYKRKIIGDYYLLSLKKKEKFIKEEKEVIKSYAKAPIIFILINRVLIQLYDYLKYKIYRIFKK